MNSYSRHALAPVALGALLAVGAYTNAQTAIEPISRAELSDLKDRVTRVEARQENQVWMVAAAALCGSGGANLITGRRRKHGVPTS